jgi:hypothetical protein
MADPIGKRRWAITEGYIPAESLDSRRVELALLSTVAFAAE